MVLSHPHRDHVELLADVIAAYEIRNVWDSGVVNPVCGYRRFLDAISDKAEAIHYRTAAFEAGTHAVEIKACDDGRPASVSLHHGAKIVALAEIPLGAGAMKILYTDPVKHGTDFNRNSLVTRLDLGGARVLFMVDAQAGDRAPPSATPTPSSIEGKLLACCLAELKADLFIAGHHGSMTSSRESFVAAVSPSVSVISSGPFHCGAVSLPDPETELGA